MQRQFKDIKKTSKNSKNKNGGRKEKKFVCFLLIWSIPASQSHTDTENI